jgi:hypothetical protein
MNVNVEDNSEPSTSSGNSNLDFLKKLLDGDKPADEIQVDALPSNVENSKIEQTKKGSLDPPEVNDESTVEYDPQTIILQVALDTTNNILDNQPVTELNQPNENQIEEENVEKEISPESHQQSEEIIRPKLLSNSKRPRISSSSDDENDNAINQKPRKSKRRKLPTERLVDVMMVEQALKNISPNIQTTKKQPTTLARKRIFSPKPSSDEENDPNKDREKRKGKLQKKKVK